MQKQNLHSGTNPSTLKKEGIAMSFKENLEKAKKVSELLKDSDIPPIAKQQAVLGVAMGCEPDTIIKGMVSTISQIETVKAEAENPKPETQPDYTETERKIADMLQESTGTNILDSGGAYGRHWQQNRKIKDFRKNPNPIVEISGSHCYTDSEGKKRRTTPEILIYYDTFHYLTNFLKLTPEAKQLQKQFEEYAELPENKDEGWFTLAEQFLEKLCKETEDSEYQGFVNTYNYDNLIYQVLQYGIITIKETDYILLQIHNGCDVRGGYTKPQFFEVPEEDYFQLAQNDVRMYCKCGYCNAFSDDGGYHWYFGDKQEEDEPIKRLKFKKDKASCKKCGSEIGFEVTEDW
jgi:hypothetical protein